MCLPTIFWLNFIVFWLYFCPTSNSRRPKKADKRIDESELENVMPSLLRIFGVLAAFPVSIDSCRQAATECAKVFRR